MINNLKEIKENLKFFHLYNVNLQIEILNATLDKLMNTLIEREETSKKAIEELQEKCKLCTSPHCGLCSNLINVINGCNMK